MSSQNLPIFKATLDLCVYIDGIVKNQEKYHKYGIGAEIRGASREMLYLLGIANVKKGRQRADTLEQLVEKCETLKSMILLAKELKAFKSFKQFEQSSHLSVNVCRQAQAWLNSSAGVAK